MEKIKVLEYDYINVHPVQVLNLLYDLFLKLIRNPDRYPSNSHKYKQILKESGLVKSNIIVQLDIIESTNRDTYYA